jgi:hypothetical protein
MQQTPKLSRRASTSITFKPLHVGYKQPSVFNSSTADRRACQTDGAQQQHQGLGLALHAWAAWGHVAFSRVTTVQVQ